MLLTKWLSPFSRLPLHMQLTLGLAMIVITVSVLFSSLLLWSNRTYHAEATQQIYQSLAQYIVDHQYEPLIDQGVVNHKALHQLAMNTMAINPLVEVYLLSPTGQVLGHALPVESVELSAIDVKPLEQKLSTYVSPSNLTLGEDPRAPDQLRLFSVARVADADKNLGYLYVVLNSSVQDAALAAFEHSHWFRLTSGALLSILIMMLVAGYVFFRYLTKPVLQLAQDVHNFNQPLNPEHSTDILKEDASNTTQSELPSLIQNVDAMKKRIVRQFNSLQENTRLRQELLSNISHDLRTPLSSMQGYIEAILLKKAQLSEEDIQRYLSIAHKNSLKLNRLITSLFELSKLDSGQVTPEIEKFSLLELVYDCRQDYELKAEELGVTIEVDAEAASYCVYADIALMQRVLQNLIDNALKFTQSGGSIALKLEKIGEDQVKVVVSDTGVGISHADAPHIFDPYYSSEHHNMSEISSHRPKGTGLGLAIVKRILSLHEAHIAMKSEPGKGTEFYFGMRLA